MYRFFLLILFCIGIMGFGIGAEAFSIKKINTYQNVSSRVGMIRQILFSQGMNFDYSKLSVWIDGLQREPRGRMKNGAISLSPYVEKDAEFIKLFVHELAHYIDIYSLLSTKDMRDLSEDFYHLSWEKPTVKRGNQGVAEFVSGYALTNQYEDFAESLVFYVFHNATFADRASRNEILRQKYLFFSHSLFPHGTFENTDFTIGRVPAYIWDTTKIPTSLEKYLYSLN